MQDELGRRPFLVGLAHAASAILLLPQVTACGGAGRSPQPAVPKSEAIPTERPADWEPIDFNKTRGNAGAIPATYHPSINGPEGDDKHLGKHLPYLPEVEPALVPDGYIVLMWGDPRKGHARHPNAVRSEANGGQGHWYDWIKIRKATSEAAEELESRYSEWPAVAAGDNGQYMAVDGGDITDDSGKKTAYLAALPADVSKGDTIRVWAHCLTHGEYVDFLTVV